MDLRTLSKIGFLLMVAGILCLILMRSLFSDSAWVILPQVLAVTLMIWARFTLGRRSFHLSADPTAGKLVTNGPYRIIRHPIYAAVVLFTWAGALYYRTLLTTLCGLAVLVGALIRIHCEEEFLMMCYPEFVHYKEKTWRLIPSVY